VVGRRIERVEIREPRLRRRIARDFAARATGQRVTAIERRAKYLVFRLGNGEAMLAHLGMSGSLVAKDRHGRVEAHDHVRFHLGGGGELVLNDPRRFGLLKIGVPEDWPELRDLGPDPLDPAFSAAALAGLLRRSRRPVKNLLIDQTTIGGVGNIYANEALFRAGIRPTRRANRVRRAEAAPLLTALRAVLEEAIALGGSSINDYRDGDGRPGYFQLQLRVYDRAGQSCLRCGATIRRLVQTGRSSFYCPRCQC
jgi:formamidopyrimidine-DNA glycosylase